MVIGNGNVARVLTLPPEWLARTDGLPFEQSRGILPTIAGRVIGDGGDPIPSVYATGWIKRGPRGVIGSNRIDATETVDALVEDYRSGTLPDPATDSAALAQLIRERRPGVIDRTGWQAIDTAERAAGAEQGRPRRKFTELDDFLRAAHGE